MNNLNFKQRFYKQNMMKFYNSVRSAENSNMIFIALLGKILFGIAIMIYLLISFFLNIAPFDKTLFNDKNILMTSIIVLVIIEVLGLIVLYMLSLKIYFVWKYKKEKNLWVFFEGYKLYRKLSFLDFSKHDYDKLFSDEIEQQRVTKGSLALSDRYEINIDKKYKNNHSSNNKNDWEFKNK